MRVKLLDEGVGDTKASRIVGLRTKDSRRRCKKIKKTERQGFRCRLPGRLGDASNKSASFRPPGARVAQDHTL
ncbi:MAG: hypothetical protein JWM11_4898 [Planctomycetaceae bacterium]|nr:hypothetical protein [Planctomycetaceae bacterium]